MYLEPERNIKEKYKNKYKQKKTSRNRKIG